MNYSERSFVRPFFGFLMNKFKVKNHDLEKKRKIVDRIIDHPLEKYRKEIGRHHNKNFSVVLSFGKDIS